MRLRILPVLTEVLFINYLVSPLVYESKTQIKTRSVGGIADVSRLKRFEVKVEIDLGRIRIPYCIHDRGASSRN